MLIWLSQHALKLRKDMVEIGRALYDHRFVVAHDGNISARLDENTIIITPTGVCKGKMTEEDMVAVDLAGNVRAGGKPTSELLMHLAIYKARPDVHAIVHAHPRVATAFAVAGEGLVAPILPEAMMHLGDVPVAPYAIPGTPAVGESLLPYLQGRTGVMLANHGAVTWGQDLWSAYYHMESLERYADTMLLAKYILGQAHEVQI